MRMATDVACKKTKGDERVSSIVFLPPAIHPRSISRQLFLHPLVAALLPLLLPPRHRHLFHSHYERGPVAAYSSPSRARRSISRAAGPRRGRRERPASPRLPEACTRPPPAESSARGPGTQSFRRSNPCRCCPCCRHRCRHFHLLPALQNSPFPGWRRSSHGRRCGRCCRGIRRACRRYRRPAIAGAGARRSAYGGTTFLPIGTILRTSATWSGKASRFVATPGIFCSATSEVPKCLRVTDVARRSPACP